MSHTLAYLNAKRTLLECSVSHWSAELQKFPRSVIGLTPDRVKQTPEWQTAKYAYDRAFADLRAFNQRHAKTLRKARLSSELPAYP